MGKFLIGLIVVILAIGGIMWLGGQKGQEATPSASVSSNQPAIETPTQTESESMEVAAISAGFSPNKVTVKAGTKVVWINKSGKTVTVNSSKHPTHLDYPPLNLGEFEDGASVSLVFDKPGTYNYHNHLNASQFGTITVE